MSTEREILTDLTTLRDEARVQLHLLSMDARARWQKLETQLESLERALDSRAEKVSESTLATARGLKHDVQAFLKEHNLPIT